MNLHKETRLNVYECLLAPGRITLRYNKGMMIEDERYDNQSEPDGVLSRSYAETQIFLVSTQVRDEALPLYLGKNLFMCHWGWKSWICTNVRDPRINGTTEYFTYDGLTERDLRRLISHSIFVTAICKPLHTAPLSTSYKTHSRQHDRLHSVAN